MIVFFKTYWERIVLLFVTVAFFLLVGSGLYLQKRNKEELKIKVRTAPESVKIQLSHEHDSPLQDMASPGSTSFYLKPLPGELMEQIAGLESLDEQVATEKFSGLPVMWEAYFFSLQKNGDTSGTVQLDVSEDGFGVMLMCDVDLLEYPEISTIESGRKIWVAGEIVSVDPSGTGTIYLKTEHIRFTDKEGNNPVSEAAVLE